METPIPDFLLLLYPFTHDQHLEACRQFNSWDWPGILAAHKPEGYDVKPNFNPKDPLDQGTKSAHPYQDGLRAALYVITNEWQRSWAHNKKPSRFHPEGMSEAEHRAWWKEKYGQ